MRHSALVAGALLLVGCGSAERSGPDAAPMDERSERGVLAEMPWHCPMMGDEDVAVDVSDTAEGVALTFTTTDGDVAELRRWVRHMVEMHRMHGAMMRRDSSPDGEESKMRMDEMMPPASASVQDVERGARIVLTPDDPAQIAALRQHARMDGDRMRAGECPMM